MGCAGCGQRYVRPSVPQAAKAPEAQKVVIASQNVVAPSDPTFDHPKRKGPRTGYNLTPFSSPAPTGGGPGYPEEALSKKDE